jgi:hypothetical protein
LRNVGKDYKNKKEKLVKIQAVQLSSDSSWS